MKYAYITVLTNEDYLLGVKVLKKSMDMVNQSKNIPFVVLVPSDANEKLLDELKESGISFVQAENFTESILQRENKVAYWKETLFKLKVFDLTQFNKIVFLDSDMIVFINLDHLFGLPHMSCVAAGQELHSDWVKLNSGLMVIEPSHKEYLGLEKLIDRVYRERTAAGFGIGDQDVIQAYYDEVWFESDKLHLSSVYNTMLGYAGYLYKNGDITGLDDIYVYHFAGKEKPWRNRLVERVAILFKILKRSNSKIDYEALCRYRRVLKQV